jgi:hypothetical protein
MVIDYLMDFNPKNIPNEINHLIYKSTKGEEKEAEKEKEDSLTKKESRSRFVFKKSKPLSMDKIRSVLRKCFFKFSNQGDPDFTKIYREMTLENLLQLTKFIQLTPTFVAEREIEKIFKKITKNKLHEVVLSFRDFIEVVTKVSYLYCHSQSPSKLASQRRPNIVEE